MWLPKHVAIKFMNILVAEKVPFDVLGYRTDGAVHVLPFGDSENWKEYLAAAKYRPVANCQDYYAEDIDYGFGD